MRSTWEEAGWERLGDGVARRRMPGWDETIGVIVGADRVMIVDTGASIRDGADLRRAIRGVVGRGVTHVALTHPHFDHVLGTAAFAGVEVFGGAGPADRLRRTREDLGRGAGRQRVAPEAA